MTATPALVWFRRDLRIHDQPALTAALDRHPRVIPVFVLDPVLIGGRFASPNRTWYLLGSLRVLAAELSRLGSPLVVRVGDPTEVVPALARAAGARDVYVSRDHAPYGRTRDARVARALSGGRRGPVGFHEARGPLVHEPDSIATADGRPHVRYSPFRRAWLARPIPPPLPTPSSLAGHDLDPGGVPDELPGADAHAYAADGPTADPARLPEPGEVAARDRLDRWFADGLTTYASSRDRLDIDGTSRLSADLHLGVLSPVEIVARLAQADDGDGPDRFRDELIWREFYAHVLFHRPDLRRHGYVPFADRMAWRDDEAAFDAWRDGRTGIPLVDAGMRQLRAAGWLPNRARMVVASFLTRHLLIDWRRGEAHFMRELVDGDVASNNGGWQWVAATGTDALPAFRILNPVLQGRRFDPHGTYVRRWVPELAGLGDARIHAPWEATTSELAAAGIRLGIEYPAPIVDLAAGRSRARQAYDAARRTS